MNIAVEATSAAQMAPLPEQELASASTGQDLHMTLADAEHESQDDFDEDQDGPGAVHWGLQGADLSESEEEAVNLFMAHVNSWRRARKFAPLSRESTVKFLMARKFAVDRALALYQQHELMRVREKLTGILPPPDQDEDNSPTGLKAEMKSGKFTVLQTRDSYGAALALFNAHMHDPHKSVHKTTLQNVVYQLDVALEDPLTQRCGLVFIYNMAGSKYANFDYDLSQKILTLLKGCYPARLKKVLIVTAPLWFKAPFKVLRLFVREKLRDRVFTVSMPQLVTHVPPEALPPILGGQTAHDHEAWLEHCALVTAKVREREKLQQSSSGESSVYKYLLNIKCD
jgi:tyrosine-protein phosphatase non-receptor type 9